MQNFSPIGIHFGVSQIMVSRYSNDKLVPLSVMDNFVTISKKGEVLFGSRASIHRTIHEDTPKYSILQLLDANDWEESAVVYYHGIGYRLTTLFTEIMKCMHRDIRNRLGGSSGACVVSVTNLTYVKQQWLRKYMAQAGFQVLRVIDSAALCGFYDTVINGYEYSEISYVAVEKDSASKAVIESADGVMEMTEHFSISAEEAVNLWRKDLNHVRIFSDIGYMLDNFDSLEITSLPAAASGGAAVYAVKFFGLLGDYLILPVAEEDYGIELYREGSRPMADPEWLIAHDSLIPVKRKAQVQMIQYGADTAMRIYIGNRDCARECHFFDYSMGALVQNIADPRKLKIVLNIDSDASLWLTIINPDTGIEKSCRLSSRYEPVNCSDSQPAGNPNAGWEEFRKAEQYLRDGLSSLSREILITPAAKGIQQILKKWQILILEKQQISNWTRKELVYTVLNIQDDFEFALKSIPSDRDQELRVLLANVYKKIYTGVLQPLGIDRIEAEGSRFDSHIHEAVSYEESPLPYKEYIIEEIQSGYYIDKKLLRAAKVRVAK